MSLKFLLRALATLLAAWAAASVCVALHTPLPWMLDPLITTAILSMTGLPTASWTPLRNLGQWTIGSALGLYFTPQVTALVGSVWWAIVLGIVWALALGWGFGALLYRWHAPRMHGVPASMMRATSYFAGAIGGTAEPVQDLFGVAQVSCRDGLPGAARSPHSSKVARAIGKRCNNADRPASHLPAGLE